MPLLYLEVTRECNLDCVMCGYPSGYPLRGEPLTTDEIRIILDDATHQLHARVVSLGGGEPFLRTDIFDLIEHAQRLGLTVHINTNGTLMDAQCVDRLARFPRLALVFSLDHPQPAANDAIRGAGVFHRCEAAITLLRQRAPGIHIGLNTLIGGHNLGALEQMVDLACRWGVHGIKFMPLHENLAHRWTDRSSPAVMRVEEGQVAGLTRELLRATSRARQLGLATSSRAFVQGVPAFHRGLARPPCHAGYLYGNIDPYGNLLPCYDHMEPLDVRAVGLRAAWRSEAMNRMRARVRSCNARCWNSGNAEPSLRLSLRNVASDPTALLADLEFLFR